MFRPQNKLYLMRFLTYGPSLLLEKEQAILSHPWGILVLNKLMTNVISCYESLQEILKEFEIFVHL